MDTTRLTTAALTGAAAGVVGTAAMDLLRFRRARAGGSDDRFLAWEFSAGTTSFDDAGAPAQVGHKLADALGIGLPDSAAGVTNDIVHWMTGVSWAVVGSLLAATTPIPPLAAGLAAAVGAFVGAYTIPPALGVYGPIWTYDADTLRQDATAHALYGAATGAALLAIDALRNSGGRVGAAGAACCDGERYCAAGLITIGPPGVTGSFVEVRVRWATTIAGLVLAMTTLTSMGGHDAAAAGASRPIKRGP